MKIIDKIINIFKFNNDKKTINNDIENNEYPTKEEYEENVRLLREKELNSERFKKTKEFLENYNNRKNIELEKALFNIVGSYGLDDHLFNKGYEEIKRNRECRYVSLKQFVENLSEEQLDSNIFLKTATELMKKSEVNCKKIVEELNDRISNSEINDSWLTIKVSSDIPKEQLYLFPERIIQTTGIPYYRPQDYKTSYINILDKENINIYQEYNKYIYKNDKLAEDIYFLQMWNLLSNLPYDIKVFNFRIENNIWKQQFNTSCLVRALSKKINASSEVNISKNDDENLTLDLRTIIDNVPADFENIILTCEIDGNMENISSNCKILVKKKR